MEKSNVFREKSIERVNSPEDLNHYIRVTNPSIWMLLAAVLILLVGITVWGVFGQLETSVLSAAVSENGTVTAFVPEADGKQIKVGQRAIVGDSTCTVTEVAAWPVMAGEYMDSYGLHVLNLLAEDWVFPVTLTGTVADGTYTARIVVDSVSPISFVIG